ncbi:MAG: hypothetical protein HC905_27260 [Bacteroidales bacterium]|nr:hypothetical protein [Bacteroidales bacterium]
MAYRFIIFPFLFIQFCGYSQSITIKGIVTDTVRQPIEFVSIGIIDKPIGTVSNKVGFFNLIVNKKLLVNNDSLRFSMIGYFPKTISLSDIFEHKKENDQFSVTLNEKIEHLNEVVISQNRQKTEVLGSHSKSLLNMFVNFSISEIPNQNLGSEIGRKFAIRNKNTQLKTFRFFLDQNNFDTVKFRLNIYSMKSFKPDENIMNSNVFIDIFNKKTGWFDVDLTPYSLVVSDDIVVSVEWISKSQKGDLLSLPIIMPTTHVHFYKFGSQNKWKRYNSMTTYMELAIKY